VTTPRLPVSFDDEGLLEQEKYLEHGGMLVAVEGEAPPELSDVVVELDAPAGRAELAARVVSVMPGVGVGLAFDDPDAVRRELAPLLDHARRTRAPDGPTNLQVRIQRMSTIEKQDLAMTGDRVARMLLMKDTNKAIHLYVLRNRQLSPDEVRIMASYRNINPDALQRIAQNQEWMRDLRIVAAIVSNPKTPPQVATRLVERLPAAEIRRLARSADAPRAVQKAARQRLHTM
jgi:hypothetical protein